MVEMNTDNYLVFIETTVFSKIRRELMKDDEFQELQSYLLKYYEEGDTISHSGGCKKIRWGRHGMGKRSGIRIIYYVRQTSRRLYLLLAYPKNTKADLTEKEKNILKGILQQLS